jgi:hypothetical protein
MRRALPLLVIAALMLASCSVLIDMGGLAGDATPDAATDAATNDAATTADASSSSDASVAADASVGDAAIADASADAEADVVVVDAGTDSSTTCATPARVQEAHAVNPGDAGTAWSVTLPGALVQADYVIVGTNYDPGSCGSVLAVTDSAGNTFTRLVPAEANGSALALETWGAANVAAIAQEQVTVTYAAACTQQNVKAVEFAGVAALSPIDTFLSTTGGPGVTPFMSLTTTGPAILFAHTADSSETMGPGAGWAQIYVDDWATLAEQQIVPEAGTYVASEAPAADDAWVIQAVALRACH